MEAVCKADFERRVNSYKDAVAVLNQAKKAKKTTCRIIVPDVGFHDIYGVWFFGRLKEIILHVGIEMFGVDLGKQMHVFVDVEPKKISDGVHEISVYGHPCRLYKWTAQGFHRGLVVLADDEEANKNAEVYRKSGTWSWML
ncbi:MAG: hypothetical protein PHI31_06580 [Desulfuromonadaceae bacterium]|nr:hypothetical protein [Desulfuromonadaceae bacterium]